MRLRERVAHTALSLVLPLLAVVLLVVFTVGSVTLAASDRAVIWAEATPSRLNAMDHRVLANEWFGGGRALPASAQRPLPAQCAPGARQYSFGGLREGEAQAAREILELIADEAGARVCLSNLFIINERPDPARQHWTQAASSVVLDTSLLPASLLLAAYLAMAGALRLAPGPRQGLSAVRRIGAGIAGAGIAWLLMAALATAARLTGQDDVAGPAMTVGMVGPGLAIALMAVVPAMMELAFRGWMLPLAERAWGTWPAIVASAGASAAAGFPETAWQAGGQFTAGVVLAIVYVRTRSLAACIVASVLLGVAAFHGL